MGSEGLRPKRQGEYADLRNCRNTAENLPIRTVILYISRIIIKGIKLRSIKGVRDLAT